MARRGRYPSLAFGGETTPRVTGVPSLVRAPHVGDQRVRALDLDLEGGHQTVLGIHDDVIRFSLLAETDGEPHVCASSSCANRGADLSTVYKKRDARRHGT